MSPGKHEVKLVMIPTAGSMKAKQALAVGSFTYVRKDTGLKIGYGWGDIDAVADAAEFEPMALESTKKTKEKFSLEEDFVAVKFATGWVTKYHRTAR